MIIQRTPDQLYGSYGQSVGSQSINKSFLDKWGRTPEQQTNTYIHLVDPIPLSQWHPAQNRTRLHLRLCAYGQRI